MQSNLLHPYQRGFPSLMFSSWSVPFSSPTCQRQFSCCWGLSPAEQGDRDFLCPAACAAACTAKHNVCLPLSHRSSLGLAPFPFHDSSQILPEELQPSQLLFCHLHRWLLLQDFNTLHLFHHHISFYFSSSARSFWACLPSLPPSVLQQFPTNWESCSHSQFAPRRTNPSDPNLSRYLKFLCFPCLEMTPVLPSCLSLPSQLQTCHRVPLRAWEAALRGEEVGVTGFGPDKTILARYLSPCYLPAAFEYFICS